MSHVLMRKDERKSHELSTIEQVLMEGDLAKLTAEQRVTYYNKVCESTGLNPYTRPFDYIRLNGKLTLYAKKDATEQLRKLNGISIEKLEENVVDDLYIVKATARTKDGRTDASTGAVTLANLKGDAKANAIMKAETKAKRRVTLSISGIGWTDETEMETIPNAKRIEVDMSTGEIKSDVRSSPCKSENNPIQKISLGQAEELKMILGDCPEQYRKWVFDHLNKQFKISSLLDLPLDIYERVLRAAVKTMESTYDKQRSEIRDAESVFEEVQ